MEVHAHTLTTVPDIHRGRKKWTHYLWEFLMLFLAVFCGFLAENFREHQVEHQREKQFIRSLTEDLETDTANLRASIESFERQDKYFDTVFTLFPQLGKGYNHSLRTSIVNLMGWKTFVATDKTIQQLKYSGGMRLIRKRGIADAIAGYDALLRANDLDMQGLEKSLDKVDEKFGEILDLQGLELAEQTKSISELEKGKENFLLKDNAATLGQYYNRLKVYRLLRRLTIGRMNKLRITATGLISFLKDEYHMK
jgi:hypothetical protein